MFFTKPFALLAFVAVLAVNAQDSASSAASATTAVDGPTGTAPASGAPGPISTAGISPCILGCVAPAATANGCSSVTDVNCVCSSIPFQDAAEACITQQCPDELDAAADLQTQICAAVTPGDNSTTSATSARPTTGPGSGTGAGTGASTGAGTGGSTAVPPPTGTASSPAGSGTGAAAESSNAAGSTKVAFGFGGAVALSATLVGAAIGALVL